MIYDGARSLREKVREVLQTVDYIHTIVYTEADDVWQVKIYELDYTTLGIPTYNHSGTFEDVTGWLENHIHQYLNAQAQSSTK